MCRRIILHARTSAPPLVGHVHSYERLQRINNFTVDRCGIQHFTIGNGEPAWQNACMHDECVAYSLACLTTQQLSMQQPPAWLLLSVAHHGPTHARARAVDHRLATHAPTLLWHRPIHTHDDVSVCHLCARMMMTLPLPSGGNVESLKTAFVDPSTCKPAYPPFDNLYSKSVLFPFTLVAGLSIWWW